MSDKQHRLRLKAVCRPPAFSVRVPRDLHLASEKSKDRFRMPMGPKRPMCYPNKGESNGKASGK